MKRFLMFLMTTSLVLILSQPVVAQERGEWQVKGGVGWFSLPDFVGGLIAGLGSIDTTEGTGNHSFSPMLNPSVEIHYGINDWFALGGSLAVGYAHSESRMEDSGTVSKSSSALYPSLCFGIRTRYFSKGLFEMYGTMGMGLMLLVSNQFYDGTNHPRNQMAATTNLYPLCLSYGGSTGGFLEAGWGAKGFVNVGVYHNF